MAALHSQVIKSTSHFHIQVRKTIFGVVEDIYHKPTPFDTCIRMFNRDPGSGNDAIQSTIFLTQLLAFVF
jgi:hypothetical protein